VYIEEEKICGDMNGMKEVPPTTGCNGDMKNKVSPPKEKDDGSKRPINAMPDMTGVTITVSAEETLQLTKDRGKSSRSRRRGDKKKDNVVTAITDTIAQSPSTTKQPSKSTNLESRANVEKEFTSFIANLSLKKSSESQIESIVKEGATGGKIIIDDPSHTDGNIEQQTSVSYKKQPSSTVDIDCETNEAVGLRKSEFLDNTIIDTGYSEGISSRRGSDYEGTNTIDENDSITSWSKTAEDDQQASSSQTATRKESENTATETTAIESASPQEDSGDVDDYNNSGGSGGKPLSAPTRLPSRRTPTQPFHRSSLRQSREKEKNSPAGHGDRGGRPEFNRGISWASLISMESKKKQKEEQKLKHTTTNSPGRRKGRDRNELNSSQTSIATPESRMSRKSHTSRGSYKSDYSRRSQGSKSSKGSRSVSWKNETEMSMASCKDPKYIRKQAKERFERGIHYAKRGKFSTARERFLMALRYRVMHYGPIHHNVAAVHEMLGQVNFFLSEEADEDEFEASLVRRSSGGEKSDEDQQSGGWDVTSLENETSKSRSNVYLQKAAMHYRTVLDILGSKNKAVCDGSITTKSSTKQSIANSSISSVGGGFPHPSSDAVAAASFKWSKIADTYKEIDEEDDSDDDEDNHQPSESLLEIIHRVQHKLSSLPVTITSKGGKTRSYVSGFLRDESLEN